jgi:molybdopterin synthase catalytic subunit
MLKDIVGRPEEVLDIGPEARVGTVFEHYAELYPKLREARKSILLARNQQFSPASDPLSEGDEVALLPPVSGGAPGYTHTIERDDNFFGLTRDPIDVESLTRRVRHGSDGAVVTFAGVARDNTNGRGTLHLDYECYEAMAIKMITEIGCEIARTHPVGRLAMVHRLGRVEIGEISVAIVVAAPHRKAAFQAATEGIDRLKRTVPIWKKETFAGGDLWVDGEWDDSVAKR